MSASEHSGVEGVEAEATSQRGTSDSAEPTAAASAIEGWLASLGPTATGSSLSAGDVLRLQRAAGNRLARQLLDGVAPPPPDTGRTLARAPAHRSPHRQLHRIPAGRPPVDVGADGLGGTTVDSFLDQLKRALCATAEAALPAPFTASGCPWIEHWIEHYRGRTAGELLPEIARYAPDAPISGTVDELIAAICDRVRAAIEQWRSTGKIPPVAADSAAPVAAPAPAPPPAPTAERALARAVLARSAATEAPVTAAGADAVSGPAAVAARLGAGRQLSAGDRTRFSAAFGREFSAVRVHDSPADHEVARGLGARAVTVGSDIVFGRGFYEPGTAIGDALIAHELAHVVQQEGAGPRPADALLAEVDANRAAIDALTGRSARPRVRGGLALDRCGLIADDINTKTVGYGEIYANAPGAPLRTFPAEDTPGRVPDVTGRLDTRHTKARIDGDGDQRKELLVAFDATEEYPDQKLKTIKVTLTPVGGNASSSAQFTLPDDETGSLAFPTLISVTNGHDPTEFSLVIGGGQVLRLWPGDRSGGGIAYVAELVSRPSGADPQAAPTVTSQRQRLGFAGADAPAKVFEVVGPAPATSGGGPGPRKIGTSGSPFWAVDLAASVYGDRWRFSFRRPAAGDDLVNMGVSVLDARTGEPQGGATIPLTVPHDRDLSVSVLPSSGISAKIDLNGDGQADVEVFDRLTQRRGVANPGSPGDHRVHELEVVGPAVRTQWRQEYRVDNEMIVAGSVHAREADAPGASDAAAFGLLDQIAPISDIESELGQYQLQLASLRTTARDGDLIGGKVYKAWATLSNSFNALAVVRGAGGTIGNDARKGMGDEANAFAAALDTEWVKDADSDSFADPADAPGGPGGGPAFGWFVPTGERIAQQLAGGFFDDALTAFRSLESSLDALIQTRSKHKFPSAVDLHPESQLADLMKQTLGQQELLRRIHRDHPDATRITAVYQVKSAWGDRGRVAEVPLSLYYWRDGGKWMIQDCTHADDAPTYPAAAAQSETEPSAKAMAELDSDHHFQAGLVDYVMPSGRAGQVVTTGESRTLHWLGIASLAAAAIGLGLLTMGAGTVALGAFTISGLVGATVAGVDLYERHHTDTLTFTHAVIDLAQIVTGLLVGPLGAAGKVLNAARLAVAAGEAVEATAMLRAANVMWVPLKVTVGVATVIDGAMLTAEAYDQMERIRNSQASATVKNRALMTFLAQLAITGGMTILSVRGESADILKGRSLAIEQVDGQLYAVPATRSVQGEAIERTRSAIAAAADQQAVAAAETAHLANIRSTLPAAQGDALANAEALALDAQAGGTLVADAKGALHRNGKPIGSLDTLAKDVAAANNVSAGHGLGQKYRIVVEAAGADGRSVVRVTTRATPTIDTALNARQLVASEQGALTAAGPVTQGIRLVDPHVRIETTPEGMLQVEGAPAVDVPRLTRELGKADEVVALARRVGAPLGRLTSDLRADELNDLLDTYGATGFRWAGTSFTGQRARSMIRLMTRDVINACLAPAASGGATPEQAERMLAVLQNWRVAQSLPMRITPRQLALFVETQEPGAAQQIVDEFLAQKTPQNFQRFMQGIESAAATSLATPAAVGRTDIMVDNNVLSPFRALLGGTPWRDLQPGQQNAIASLFQALGKPLARAGGVVVPPTKTDLEGILPRLRTPATVIGEAGPRALVTPPGGGKAIDLGEVPRPVAVDLRIDRDTQVYRDVLDALARPKVAPWQQVVGTDVTTKLPFGASVGKGGVRDHTVVADAIFAKTPLGDPVPRLLTNDARIYERLAGFATKPGGLGMPPAGESPAAWLARTNASGFEIDINGNKLMVVPVAP